MRLKIGRICERAGAPTGTREKSCPHTGFSGLAAGWQAKACPTASPVSFATVDAVPPGLGMATLNLCHRRSACVPGGVPGCRPGLR